MATRSVFISYSRRDFYFAEAVMETLKGQGLVDPWIDVHDIRPGMDWAEAIASGLDRADALILLASPSSLRSVYVEREWRRALARGIPVHVAVIDSVELPVELRSCSVIDIRLKFQLGLANLGNAIAKDSAQVAGGVSYDELRQWPGMPGPLAALAVIVVLTSVSALWVSVVLFRIGVLLLGNDQGRMAVMNEFTGRFDRAFGSIIIGVGVSSVGIAAFVAYWLYKFLSRQGNQASSVILWIMMMSYAFILGVLSFSCSLIDRLANEREVGEATPPLGIGATLIFALGAAACVIVGRSLTAHMWSRTGEGELGPRARLARMNRKYGGSLRQDFRRQWSKSIDFSPVNFGDSGGIDVHCEPRDESVAEMIRWAAREVGIPATPASKCWHLVLVSSGVDAKNLAEDISRLGLRVICVMVDSVKLATDVDEIWRHHWFDFREQQPDALYGLFSVLFPGKAGVPTLPVVPIGSERVRSPGGVDFLRLNLLVYGASFYGYAVSAVAERGMNLQTAALLILAALEGALVVNTSYCISVRGITVRRFRSRVMLMAALALPIAVCALAMHVGDFGYIYNHHQAVGETHAVTVDDGLPTPMYFNDVLTAGYYGLVALMFLFPFVPTIYAVVMYRRLAVDWLPRVDSTSRVDFFISYLLKFPGAIFMGVFIGFVSGFVLFVLGVRS
ncbi:toll/interleukin-1 receptor domain-containing protein [Kutzneria sp. CA-103260]|uniref:toll/interleukin-1 receptor domain-containing protein n=1 Tax=Kutzneria sp. CA-103260 TaxID=2802641 RepID=UPI001BA4C0BD|nr:toll/interleukin-1 receptor domain-containing protein [Kutzneria sp. CA-103260]QUQ65066.1 TIR domain protein [Kutzneria sp. CA-103260]